MENCLWRILIAINFPSFYHKKTEDTAKLFTVTLFSKYLFINGFLVSACSLILWESPLFECRYSPTGVVLSGIKPFNSSIDTNLLNRSFCQAGMLLFLADTLRLLGSCMKSSFSLLLSPMSIQYQYCCGQAVEGVVTLQSSRLTVQVEVVEQHALEPDSTGFVWLHMVQTS